MNEVFPLAGGKGEATCQRSPLNEPAASTGRQLRSLQWRCTYQQAGCFESMLLAPSPEDAEESFGTSKCSFCPIMCGEKGWGGALGAEVTCFRCLL